MAEIVNVIMTDDLDGTESTENDPVETRRFSIGAGPLEIDLRRSNFEKLQNAVAPFAEKARTTSRGRQPATPVSINGASIRPAGRVTHVGAPRDMASRERGRQIRAWAQDKGIPIGKKGRIPRQVELDYNAAHAF